MLNLNLNYPTQQLITNGNYSAQNSQMSTPFYFNTFLSHSETISHANGFVQNFPNTYFDFHKPMKNVFFLVSAWR